MTNLFWGCLGAIAPVAIFWFIGWTIRRNRRLGNENTHPGSSSEKKDTGLKNLAWWHWVIILGSIGLLSWVAYVRGVDDHRHQIAENYHYSRPPVTLEDTVITHVLADPIFGKGPANLQDAANRSYSTTVVIPNARHPRHPKLLRITGCKETFWYRYKLLDSGKSINSYTDPIQWNPGDDQFTADNRAAWIEIWVERPNPNMPGAYVYFYQYPFDPKNR